MKYSEQLRNQQETHDRVEGLRDRLFDALEQVSRQVKAPGLAKIQSVADDLRVLSDDVAPELPEVVAEPGVDGCAAVGRVIMGGIALALTRKSDTGELLLVVENESPTGPTMLRIELMTGASLWRGDVD